MPFLSHLRLRCPERVQEFETWVGTRIFEGNGVWKPPVYVPNAELVQKLPEICLLGVYSLRSRFFLSPAVTRTQVLRRSTRTCVVLTAYVADEEKS
ncbi:hypothetical protein GW17_00012973 [Ensete ventricosum]|nr:hypothetical protein GW17_00012973 [Ensete ventricosum]RZS25390.1 hypothetical protein BHM03_00058581 [Ensete ventricosum]